VLALRFSTTKVIRPAASSVALRVTFKGSLTVVILPL
jgi:hypothetical protein